MENKIPKETMEQHMYNYFNQRFGLKSLIIEWSTAILNGIKKFGNEDNDIAYFGKVLKNEVDEEFRYVLQEIKNSVQLNLRRLLMEKNPKKPADFINRLFKEKMTGKLLE